MSTTITPLLPENWYHIYNRGISGERLFFEDKNVAFFLKLLTRHVLGVAEIYAYCLLGNHFHLLVRIREKPAKKTHFGFSHLFNSYAQAINRRYGRAGSPFDRPFRRKLIESEVYRSQLVFYIHNNPRHHSVCEDFRCYPHSSYKAMLSQASTNVMRASVLDWFDGRQGFIDFHQREHDFCAIRDYIIE